MLSLDLYAKIFIMRGYLKYDSINSSNRKMVFVNEGGLSRESIIFGPKVLARCPSSSISASLLNIFDMLVRLCREDNTSLTVLGFLFPVIIFCASCIPSMKKGYQITSIKRFKFDQRKPKFFSQFEKLFVFSLF